jgi:uncharacterized protein (TIGR03083 family)
MNSFPLASEHYWILFAQESASFLNAYARANIAENVPDCPEWNVAQLGRHLGGIYLRCAKIFDRRVTERVEMEKGPDSADGVAAWVAGGAQQLIESFLLIDATTPLWTPAGIAPAAFWMRRLTHETMIHTFDLERLHGPIHRPDPKVIVDGIDEFFHVLLTRKIKANAIDDLLGTLAISPTDNDARWVLGFTPNKMTLLEPGQHIDAELTGRSIDLLMFLWKRNDTAALGATGDIDLISSYQKIDLNV